MVQTQKGPARAGVTGGAEMVLKRGQPRGGNRERIIPSDCEPIVTLCSSGRRRPVINLAPVVFVLSIVAPTLAPFRALSPTFP